jgi:hypothetical protein
MGQLRADSSLKLLLYRTAPAYETAWMAGYEAAQAEMPESENPFQRQDDEYKAWHEGWWAGFYNEAPLYAEEANLHRDHSTLQCEAIQDHYLQTRPLAVAIPFTSRFANRDATRWMFLFAFLVGCVALYAWMAAE